MNSKKSLFVALGFAAIIISVGLSFVFDEYALQIRAIGILSACLILWISESLPISISTLLIIVLLPIMGLMDFESAVSSFGINSSLFIMASSGLTIAICKSAIPKILTSSIVGKSYRHPVLLVICLALLVSLFSAFVSSLATCVLFTLLISEMLNEIGVKTKESKLGKSLMLIIPACAGIGGFMSPAGTPANILVIDLLKQRGVNISFIKWCCIGFPIGIFATLLFAFSVIVFLKPHKERINTYEKKDLKFNRNDKLILIIFLLVIAGWVASSFVSVLSTTMVALLGLAALFLPTINLLSLDEFGKGVNWDLVISMGAVSVVMTAISNSGLLTDISNYIFKNAQLISPLLLMIVISFVICVLRSFIPTTTAVIALFAPALISISEKTSLGVAPLLMLASFWAATALLLIYTEPIYLITYKKGYFKQKDLLKAGSVPAIILIVVGSLGIFYLTNLII